MIPKERKAVESEKVALAEFGTLSLEFRYLSKFSGNATYERLVDRIYDCVKTLNHTAGLLPLNISRSPPLWLFNGSSTARAATRAAPTSALAPWATPTTSTY